MATVDLKTLFNDKSLPILNPVPNKAALDAIVTTDLLPGTGVFQFDEAIFYRWDGADFLPFQFQQSVRNNYSDPLDPTSADNMSLNFTSGSIWINSVSKEVFICITSNMNTAEWKSLGSSQSVIPLTYRNIFVGNSSNEAEELIPGSNGQVFSIDENGIPVWSDLPPVTQTLSNQNIYVGNANNEAVQLPPGTPNQILKIDNSNNVSWGTISSENVSSLVTATIDGSGTGGNYLNLGSAIADGHRFIVATAEFTETGDITLPSDIVLFLHTTMNLSSFRINLNNTDNSLTIFGINTKVSSLLYNSGSSNTSPIHSGTGYTKLNIHNVYIKNESIYANTPFVQLNSCRFYTYNCFMETGQLGQDNQGLIFDNDHSKSYGIEFNTNGGGNDQLQLLDGIHENIIITSYASSSILIGENAKVNNISILGSGNLTIKSSGELSNLKNNGTGSVTVELSSPDPVCINIHVNNITIDPTVQMGKICNSTCSNPITNNGTLVDRAGNDNNIGNDYGSSPSTNSFTTQLTGAFSPTTGDYILDYQIVGGFVFLSFPQYFSTISSSTSIQFNTIIPESIRPVSQSSVRQPIMIRNNGIDQVGEIFILGNGNVTIMAPNQSAFILTNDGGICPTTIIYRL